MAFDFVTKCFANTEFVYLDGEPYALGNASQEDLVLLFGVQFEFPTLIKIADSFY